jgi:hypothetical protein
MENPKNVPLIGMDSPLETLVLRDCRVKVKEVAGGGSGTGGGSRTVSLYAAGRVAVAARALVTPRGI